VCVRACVRACVCARARVRGVCACACVRARVCVWGVFVRLGVPTGQRPHSGQLYSVVSCYFSVKRSMPSFCLQQS
jgi:hypothetical protein